MYKQKRLTIPANTSKDQAVEETLEVVPGTLKLITVEFPAGCHDLVYIQVLQSNNIIVPDDASEGIVGNDITLPIEFNDPIDTGKTKIVIRGWNFDDTYPHTITVGMNVLKEYAKPKDEEYLKQLSDQIKALSQFLGVGK